jgi:hypothetical protein
VWSLCCAVLCCVCRSRTTITPAELDHSLHPGITLLDNLQWLLQHGQPLPYCTGQGISGGSQGEAAAAGAGKAAGTAVDEARRLCRPPGASSVSTSGAGAGAAGAANTGSQHTAEHTQGYIDDLEAALDAAATCIPPLQLAAGSLQPGQGSGSSAEGHPWHQLVGREGALVQVGRTIG